MREYKFRAWHGGHKHAEPQMLYDEKPGDCLRWKAEGQNIVSIMQYAGVMDVYSKEIFEDDIIETEEMYYTESGSYGGMRKVRGKVVFTNGRYALHKTTGALPDLSFGCNSHRVIGNIHTHPHLLEQGEKTDEPKAD